MAIAINSSSSLTAIVPAVYGTATPVIDVGDGASSLGTAIAFSNVRSVVVNLVGTPKGGVTYSASGLMNELSQASIPAAAADKIDTQPQSQPRQAPEPLPPMLRHADGVSVPGLHESDPIYNSSGVLTPTRGIPAEAVTTFKGSPAQSEAAPIQFSPAVGTLIGTKV